MEKEICICAAIKTKSGKIYPGRRHGHCIVGIYYCEKEDREEQEQGFLTNYNRFVDRKEGRKLQEEAGIPSADPEGYRYDILFSEDLY
jgi:hypothetical protein